MGRALPLRVVRPSLGADHPLAGRRFNVQGGAGEGYGSRGANQRNLWWG